MKKNIFALGVFSLMLLGACTKNANENTEEIQSSVSSSESLRAPIDCPGGTHAVIVHEFDEFHFHRPRKGCKSGFWFCTIGEQWHIECRPDRNYRYASINGTTAYTWAQVLENGKVEIHFPLALKNTEGYTPEDLAMFNVDEEYEIYEGITLKTGDYSVTETDTELVVIIDLL